MSGDAQQGADRQTLGRLAHRMNNSLAYVLTNIGLLVEELESLQGLLPDHKRRLLRLADDAAGGAGAVGELIRELQQLGWEDTLPEPVQDHSEDTWDVDGEMARLLVIDDEEPILTSLGLALRHYNVTSCTSVAEAVEKLGSGAEFDLILCDLIMPEKGGIDMYRWLQRNRRDLANRIMFMTGGAFTPELRDFLAAVRNTVLHKPFDTKTLRWMVAQQLRRANA